MKRARVVPEIEKYGFLALIGAFVLFLVLTFVGRDRGTPEPLRPDAERPPVARAKSVVTKAAPGAATAGAKTAEGARKETPADAPRTWTVARGDTLASIARRALGNAANWPLLVKANPGLDAKNLKAGQVLNLPALPAKSKPPAVATAKTPAKPSGQLGLKPGPERPRIHVVQNGDTLRSIAQRYYRDPDRWRDVLAANREVLEDQDKLIGGVSLVVP